MGNYSRGISKRIQHTRIKEGYCLICGAYGVLTDDHVPPKGSITITKVEQRLIAEVIGGGEPVKGVCSMNGSRFKTICRECNNNVLGANDSEVAGVCKSLTAKIISYFNNRNSPINTVSVPCDVIKFSRAMIGHILSATSVDECKEAQEPSPYFCPLKKFVLGDDSALNDSHDIYYWFYPYRCHLSAKFMGFFNNGHVTSLSVLSFFPISFMVTLKDSGIYPGHALRLNLTDDRIVLNLSYRGRELSTFPFHGIHGNQFILMNDSQAVITYPI